MYPQHARRPSLPMAQPPSINAAKEPGGNAGLAVWGPSPAVGTDAGEPPTELDGSEGAPPEPAVPGELGWMDGTCSCGVDVALAPAAPCCCDGESGGPVLDVSEGAATGSTVSPSAAEQPTKQHHERVTSHLGVERREGGFGATCSMKVYLASGAKRQRFKSGSHSTTSFVSPQQSAVSVQSSPKPRQRQTSTPASPSGSTSQN